MDTKNIIATLSQSLLDEVKKVMKKKGEKDESPAHEKSEKEDCSEALKGNQHKIDANKNGKVDAHDFKLLRKKKGVAETYTSLKTGEEISEEEVEEAVKEPYAVGMAAAMKATGDKPPLKKSTIIKAHKIAKKIKEETEEVSEDAEDDAEQIDELSTKTLRSYLQKNREAPSERQYKQKHNQGYERAVGKLTGQSYRAVGDQGATIGHKKPKVLSSEETTIEEGMDRVVDNGHTPIGRATQHAAKLISSHTKRKHYFDGGDLVDHETDKTVVHNAASKPIHVVKKLAKDYHAGVKEEVENIDELSKTTLATYAIKAKNQMGKDEARAGYQRGIRTMDGKGQGAMERAHDKRAEKRSKGIDNALNKLAKEEVQIDELSKGTLASYVKKAAGSAANNAMEHGKKKAEQDEVDRLTNRHMSFGDKDKIHKTLKTTHRDVEAPREKAGKRIQGINRAVTKLAKEEVELSQEEIERLDAMMAELEEGRGRPPKEGSEAWKKRQAEGAAQADEPRQHPIQQLERIKRDMRGGGDFLHKDGSTHHVTGPQASKLLDKYHGMKPAEKEDMQREIHGSHAGMKKHL